MSLSILLKYFSPSEEELAIAKVHDLGGSCRHDGTRPDRPVVEVSLPGPGFFTVTDGDLVVLRRFPHLETVGLGRCRTLACAIFQDLPPLFAPSLSNSAITDQGLKSIVKMPSVNNVTTLTLSNTRITDEGISYLKELKNLRYLHLTDTAITDVSVGYLSEIPRLGQVYVSGTRLTKNGISDLQKRHPGLGIFEKTR